ncbi:dipeptidase [Ruminococcaceae bacterium OttesenSCG-928-O06]|nr:dipeptidase [Ruminococcaceae bacterium OttesenSCG-928-O06]
MSDKAKTLMKQNIVLDGLYHGMLIDPPPECGIGRDVVDMILDGGVNCVVDSIVADGHPIDFDELLVQVYSYNLLQDLIPEKFLLVEKFEDIERAKQEGKLACVFSTQGTDCFEGDLRKFSIAYKLGFRVVQITYNNECSIGCGVYVKNDTGLTRFGEQAIAEMNRLGMVIDVSHVGHTTAMQAIELSSSPVIYSHAGVKKISNHIRNADDAHIKAIAKTGGVFGVCPHGIMNTMDLNVRPTVENYIDSFLHIADITGSFDYIGIGTDRWSRTTLTNNMKRISFDRITKGFFGTFDGDSKHVQGFNYYDEWENLVDRMLARGISEEDTAKILGGNFMRVFKQVWK